MPVIGFRGFTAGAPVALLADQGAVSVGNSVASWGSALGEIGIEARGADTPVAPAAFWLKATGASGFTLSTPPAGTAYDPAFHEITYIWTVRGRPLAPFSAPENLVTGWNDPNVMYGAEVAFAFPDPGTYTIDLWCIDRNGVTATAETSVTVEDPDVVYSGTRTLCLALDGDFTGAPAGAVQYTDVASLRAAIQSAAQPIRVLLKRGETVSGLAVNRTANFGYYGSWGSGARAIVDLFRRTASIDMRNKSQMTVTGLDFRGTWDADTETGSPSDEPFLSILSNTVKAFFHYHDCRFSGIGLLEGRASSAAGSATVISNTTITNWTGYGIFSHRQANQQFFGLIGSSVAQSVDALNGGPKNGLYNDHGPLRIENFTNICIAQSDFFSRNGWSPLGPDVADQPCIRLNTSPQAQGNRANIERITCEGGFRQIALETQNGATPEFDANYVLDKVLCISTARSIGTFIALKIGGTTLRNVIGVVPNVPAYYINDWRGGVQIDDGAEVTANLASPMTIHNTSFVNSRNTANDPGHVWPVALGDDLFDAATLENNIAFAPDIDTPVNGTAPIDLAATIPGVVPRYRGVRFNFDHEEGTLASDVVDGASFILPYPASTDQTYWQAIEAVDTRHFMSGLGDLLLSESGDFSVTFGASNITITNTSGRTWAAGDSWFLRLDRKSLLPPMDETYSSIGQPLSLPSPIADSSEIGKGDMGRRAHDDFLVRVRPQTGDTRGALLPG